MRAAIVIVLLLAACANGLYHMASVTTYFAGATCGKPFHSLAVIDDFCNMHDCKVYRNNSYATTCDDFPPALKFPVLAQTFSDNACQQLRNVTGYATGACLDLPDASVVTACRSDGKAAFFHYTAPLCKGTYKSELFASGACAPWGNGGSIRVTCHE